MTRLSEHAAIFKGFLPTNKIANYDLAFGLQNYTTSQLLRVTDQDDALNKQAFISLGGIVHLEPSNRQDPDSPLIERWRWGNGMTAHQNNFIIQPLAPMLWLEFFPGIRWRLESLEHSFGAKIYRTIHNHPMPTVALTLACINYAQVLLRIIQDDDAQHDDLTKIETTQGITD